MSSNFKNIVGRGALAIVVMLLWQVPVSAQVNAFAGAGYQGNYVPVERLNFVIDRFNETRNSLQTPMPSIQYLGGPTVTAGVGGGTAAFIATYKRYDHTVKGTWTDGGSTLTTHLKVEGNDYGVAFGAVPGIGNSFTFGMGLEITFLDLRIKADVPSSDGYNEVERYLQLGFAPYAQFFIGLSDHFYLYLKPSYTLDARFSDFFVVNKAINPSTYQMDEDISHEGKFNRVGLMAGVVFSIGGDAIGRGRY